MEEQKNKKRKNERFEECYNKYYSLIMCMALESLKRREPAEDICQQVFVSFYQNMNRIGLGFEKPWLVRCTKNQIIDVSRKNVRRKEYSADMEELAERMGLADGRLAEMDEHLDSSRLLKRIIGELRKINTGWFEALRLSCIEGLSCDEAARRLGITPDAMRARLYRARVYVREHYGTDYFA